MIISIDGPAGSGKSTVAKLVATKLNFIHFNSGLLYRAITAYLLDNNVNIETFESFDFANIDLQVNMQNGAQHVYVNNTDYTPKLRTTQVNNLVATVSLNSKVQMICQDCLKQFCNSNNVVIEGRGIGSFVLPKAEHKFYLDCSIKERAKRRFLEEKAKNPEITIEKVEKLLEKRDFLDKTREIAPLIIPENAIVIDSTVLTIDQVVSKIIKNIKNMD